MTENEYILATDIRALDCAMSALREVMPENNKAINEEDYRKVFGLLRDWREKSARLIRVR